jgi:hypothetical protein
VPISTVEASENHKKIPYKSGPESYEKFLENVVLFMARRIGTVVYRS